MSIGCVNYSFQNASFFPVVVLALLLWIFYLSLLVGDKFFSSDDKWNCHLVIGFRYDLQVIIHCMIMIFK